MNDVGLPMVWIAFICAGSLDPTIIGGNDARIWMLEDCKGANLYPHSCQILRSNE